ncbi:uncharacterized protein LOC143499240 [Brachyhypopomus gauderio]|uniref:uncharacterized protein LOC143499240 n=1 Tax=Brachyhypopomus gauderio TaxID=698409 RepID=UPI004041418D
MRTFGCLAFTFGCLAFTFRGAWPSRSGVPGLHVQGCLAFTFSLHWSRLDTNFHLFFILRLKISVPSTPWLNQVLRSHRRDLRTAERRWKRSRLDSDLRSYQSLLSKFSLEVTSAKSAYYRKKFESSASNPRKLFSIFSSLLNPPSPPTPSSLTPEDFVIFFEEKIAAVHQSFSPAPNLPTSTPNPTLNSLASFSPLSSDKIHKLLTSSNPTTCPLDPIPSTLFQNMSRELLPFISAIINNSLVLGHVPTVFKMARVVPILKKATLDTSDMNNYRPVSLLSFLSKTLERAVYGQLSLFLTQNQLHDPNQSGFKRAHSTETALKAGTEKLHAAKANKLSSVLILLDLSAAFDIVNHNILLSVLSSLGVTGSAWKWFQSYLEDRSYQNAAARMVFSPISPSSHM